MFTFFTAWFSSIFLSPLPLSIKLSERAFTQKLRAKNHFLPRKGCWGKFFSLIFKLDFVEHGTHRVVLLVLWRKNKKRNKKTFILLLQQLGVGLSSENYD
jgi:hypothetical protein